MSLKNKILKALLLVQIAILGQPVWALPPRMANVFGDHQVLQRGMPTPVWGMADPGAPVMVAFAGQSKNAVADADGRWCVTLDPLEASGEGRELTVSDGKAKSDGPRQKMTDVLVGDVWLCAGPGGGFERPTARLGKNAASEVSKAAHPKVRLLRPVLYGALLPVNDIDPANRWRAVTPESIGDFPISWYFARELHAAAGVPVGLIQVHSGMHERPGEWLAWKLDPKNSRQAQTLAAVAERLPADIAAVESWLEEMNRWEFGKVMERGFPHPFYIHPEVDGSSPLNLMTSCAYNFNVAPFAGMGLRGVVFLNDFGKSSVAKDDLSRLVTSWREAWGRPEMPFLFPAQAQRQTNAAQMAEALARVASVPMVKVIPAPAEADPMTPNDTLWRQVAALAKDIPFGPVADVGTVRKWMPAVVVNTAKENARLETACLFGDNMVVQTGMPVPVWGWGRPGAEVSVSFAGQSVKGSIGASGEWRVILTPLTKSAVPQEMTITSKLKEQVETLKFGNALIGEVWGNSGQSNAGRVMGATLGFAEEKPKANWPEIRCLRVAAKGSGFPIKRARGHWEVVTPETVGGMPGQGYYFAKQIHQQLKTPVGIVSSSVGGSTIYAWTTEAALSASPKLKPLLADMVKYRDARIARFSGTKEMLRNWVDEARRNGGAARPMPFYPVDGLLLEGIEARGGLLYNAMIHPIIGTTVRGFLWNQGEADTGAGVRSETYTELMETMVAEWRKSWGYEFPFYFVQMPAIKARAGLTEMWESQTRAMHRIPKSGMIVCNDISDGDIHPADKKNVGERLARLALARTYGVKDMIDSSPFMTAVKRDGSRVKVAFAPAGDGLKTRDGKPPDSWELAGADGKFLQASAKLEKDSVVVEAPGIARPAAVRLGWTADSNCNLINSAGLPAMPFSAKIEN